MALELNIRPAEVPKVSRAGGSGRGPELWENHLAPYKDGNGYLVSEHEKKESADTRKGSMRKRLVQAVPHESWDLVSRAIPNTDPVRYGVYVTYKGTLNAEQMTQAAAKRQANSERGKARAQARQAANGSETEANSPAKERVKQPRSTSK